LANLKNKVLLAVFAAIGGAVFLVIFKYSKNIPNADDFDMFLGFLESFSSSPGIGLFFQKHGEHIVLPARLYALLSYNFFGAVNFRYLILLGVPILGTSIALIVRIFPAHQQRSLLIPISALIFTPAYFESLMWAAGVVQHILVLPIIVAGIIFSTNNLLFSTIFCIAATMTQGNGLLTPLACSIVFLWERNFRRALYFLTLFLVLLPLFLTTEGVTLLPTSIFEYAMIFLGASIASSVNAAFWIGLFLSGMAMAVLFKRQGPIENRMLILVIFLTAFVNALARLKFGVDYAFWNSRYSLPSLVFLAALLASLAQYWTRSTRLTVVITCICISRFVVEFPSFIAESQLRSELLQDSVQIKQVCKTGLEYPAQDRASRLVEEGFWTAPKQELIPSPLEISVPKSVNGKISWHLEHFCSGDGLLVGRGYILPSSGSVIGLSFKSKSANYFIAAGSRIRPDILLSQKQAGVGFFLLGTTPPKDLYTVSIIWKDKAKVFSQPMLEKWDQL